MDELPAQSGDNRLAGTVGFDRIDGALSHDTTRAAAADGLSGHVSAGATFLDFEMGEGEGLDFTAEFGPDLVNAANINRFAALAPVDGSVVQSADSEGLGSATSVAIVTLTGATGLDPLDMLTQGGLTVG